MAHTPSTAPHRWGSLPVGRVGSNLAIWYRKVNAPKCHGNSTKVIRGPPSEGVLPLRRSRAQAGAARSVSVPPGHLGRARISPRCGSLKVVRPASVEEH